MTKVEFYDVADRETDTLLSTVAYTYDYLGRRISPLYDGDYYQHLHFTYDGWNIIQETGNYEPMVTSTQFIATSGCRMFSDVQQATTVKFPFLEPLRQHCLYN